NVRYDPRALVCARALVQLEGGPATEHMTYDLSAGGVRLCGLPKAKPGDRLSLLLHLPTLSVQAVGRLLRVTGGEYRPEFALQFEDMNADGEDAIQDAVLDALVNAGRRSLLVLRGKHDLQWQNWEWLKPLSPISSVVATPLEALQHLEKNDISVAIVGRPQGGPRLPDWGQAIPTLAWRAIDRAGRLWSTDLGS
ncbi:MAG: PilZ domain-containing protein, partial [Deltaproteobacteria bacterium]|nr:PilZ domain-containing protein [Deltaproteobacteria bacterium]